MSAYIVEENHIEYLVDVMTNARHGIKDYWEHDLGVKTAREVGQLLWDENYRSVNYRYGEKDKAPEFHYRRKCYDFDPLQVLHSISCYEYQTCEHPEWKDSNVKKLLSRLKSRMINILTDGKIWGAPEPLGRGNVVRLSALV